MAKIDEPLHTTANMIYSLYEQKKEKPRPYLGWSQIGDVCERKIWLDFRWAIPQVIEPRIKRLFDTGFREEDRILEELKLAGCEVLSRDEEGNQFGCKSFGGHLSGHLDAKVLGLPSAPKTWHLVDVKTIKSKKFDQLLKDGMEKMYPKYWAQCHGYMGEFGLTRAEFIFVCKDDDRIWSERFHFDEDVYLKHKKRAEQIIFSNRIPPPISASPSWYQCKFCDAYDFCHQKEQIKEKNCRTCFFSRALPDGSWFCKSHQDEIPLDFQYQGCDNFKEFIEA